MIRTCPECDSARVRLDGGCPSCLQCGWSKCGPPRADGGTISLPDVGDHVQNRENDDDSEAIVLNVHPDTPASDYWIDGLNGTVAQYNPDYDPSAPVVTIAFCSEVRDKVSGWRSINDLKLAAAGGSLKAYDYPAPRLEVVGDG